MRAACLRLAGIVLVGLSTTCSIDPFGVAPAAAPTFTKRTLDTDYRAEGVAILDVDHDGHLDIVTDEYWYAGPQFDVRHEIRPPETFEPAATYSHDCAVYPHDVDGDGWLDIIVAPHPTDEMFWYKNPAGADTHWPRHTITSVNVAGVETPIVGDLFGDGHPVLLMTNSVDRVLGWYTPPPDPTQPWVLHPITGPQFPGGAGFVHGLGMGDVNGDGRTDVMTGYGWFEQTSDRSIWTSHPFAFGPGPADACSRMWTYDIDSDGLADIVCGRPHDFGLHWFGQQRVAPGADPTFMDHLIDPSVQEMHDVVLQDLNGDGSPEIISGKRWWAHGPAGEGGDPPVVVYYALHRNKDGPPSFDRHVADADSGIGTQFSVADVNGDAKPDIITSNKKGLFVLLQN